MINSFLCTNIFSKSSKLLIDFYHEKLGIPILNTIVNDSDGVNLGFLENAPTICIWDANKWGAPVQGTTSLVFICDNLNETCSELNKKGLVFDPPVKFEWGTHELRLRDPDGNEIVVVELNNQ
jgi:predicted enzyme related to lactoylglutathione lyase